MINKRNIENTVLIILMLVLLGVNLTGCARKGNNKNDLKVKKWERASAEPTIIQSSLQKNRLVDFNLLIKDMPEEVIVEEITLEGNLQFDNGSLTIINAGLKLPKDCYIEFLRLSGNIELTEASLKTAGLINADIEAGRGSKIHLYGNAPFKNSKINICGTDISLYLYNLSREYVISNILNKNIISIEGKSVNLPHGEQEINTGNFKLKISDFENGSKITIDPIYTTSLDSYVKPNILKTKY